MTAAATNVGFGSTFGLTNVSLSAHGQLAALGDVPEAQLAVAATASVLGHSMSVFGSLTMSAAGLTGASLWANPGSLTLGGVFGVSGPGCVDAPDFVKTLDPAITAAGPCIGVSVDLLATIPLDVEVGTSLKLAGITLNFEGAADAQGLSIHGALGIIDNSCGNSVDSAGLGSCVAVDGHLYYGNLNGITAPNVAGTLVAVHAGDVSVQASLNTSVPLAGFHVGGSFWAGRLGGNEFVKASGGISVLGTSAQFSGQFSVGTAGFNWALTASGQLSVAGYPVVATSATLSSTGIALSGKLNFGSVFGASLNGSVTMASGSLHASLTGTANLDAGLFAAQGSVDLEYSSGTVSATVTVHQNISSVVSLNATASFSTAGDICLSASASVTPSFAGPGLNLISINGTGVFCNTGPNAGVQLTFNALGFTATAMVTPTAWSMSGTVDESFSWTAGTDDWNLTASGNFDAGIGVSTLFGLTASANGGLDFSGTAFGKTINLVGVAVTGSLSTNPLSIDFCASTSVLFVSVSACVNPPSVDASL